jgi:hypothetical protein
VAHAELAIAGEVASIVSAVASVIYRYDTAEACGV